MRQREDPATHCFVGRDAISDWIYVYRDNVGEVWASLLPRVRVVFRIAFSFAGVNAFDLRMENLRTT